MKKKLLALTVISVAALNSAQAANQYNVTISPVDLVFSELNFSVNYGITDNMSVGLGGGFAGRTGATTINKKYHGQARLNYYLSGKRFSNGWYVAPVVDYFNLSSSSESAFGFSGLVGYHLVFDSGFNILTGAGLKYTAYSSGVSTVAATTTSPSGIDPTFEFNLGYTF